MDGTLLLFASMGSLSAALTFTTFLFLTTFAWYSDRRKSKFGKISSALISKKYITRNNDYEKLYHIVYKYRNYKTDEYTQKVLDKYINQYCDVDHFIPRALTNLCLEYLGTPCFYFGPFEINEYVDKEFYDQCHEEQAIEIIHDAKYPTNCEIKHKKKYDANRYKFWAKLSGLSGSLMVVFWWLTAYVSPKQVLVYICLPLISFWIFVVALLSLVLLYPFGFYPNPLQCELNPDESFDGDVDSSNETHFEVVDDNIIKKAMNVIKRAEQNETNIQGLTSSDIQKSV